MNASLWARFTTLVSLGCLLVLTFAACKATAKVNEESALLRGGEWRLVTMQGAAVGDNPRVTLQFADDHKFNGRAFINQYFGSYTLGSNGSLAMGPVGATRMAGPEPLMQQENTYIQLLGQVDRCEVSRETLALMHGGTPLLVYGRSR